MTRAMLGMLALSSAVVLAGCTLQTSESIADYPAYATSGDIIRAADVVVRGTSVRSRVERAYPDVSTSGDPVSNPQAGLSEKEAKDAREAGSVVVTVSSVKVLEVVKGNVKVGDTIEVSQLGGTLSGVANSEKHTTILPTDGSQYVLLLAAFDPGHPYSLLNPEQAMYAVSSDGTLSGVGDATDAPLERKTVRDLKAEQAAQKK